MSDLTDRIVAIKAVIDRVQPNAAPTLTVGEIEFEVDRAKSASTWTANTAYNADDRVMPSIRNGRRYRAQVGGTSGTTDPFANLTGAERQIVVADGSDILWVEDGPQYRNIYDIRQASYQCWDIRVRRTAQLVIDGDVSFQQLHEQCRIVRDSFEPLGLG